MHEHQGRTNVYVQSAWVCTLPNLLASTLFRSVQFYGHIKDTTKARTHPKTSIQNPSSPHDYGCFTTQEIPCLLEDLNGDYHYKRLHINILKAKYNLLRIRNQPVPLCNQPVPLCNQSVPLYNHFPPVIKNNQLMMYKAKVAVCSVIRTKRSTPSEHHVELLNVTPSGT
jgi:hypothetical protein